MKNFINERNLFDWQNSRSFFTLNLGEKKKTTYTFKLSGFIHKIISIIIIYRLFRDYKPLKHQDTFLYVCNIIEEFPVSRFLDLPAF